MHSDRTFYAMHVLKHVPIPFHSITIESSTIHTEMLNSFKKSGNCHVFFNEFNISQLCAKLFKRVTWKTRIHRFNVIKRKFKISREGNPMPVAQRADPTQQAPTPRSASKIQVFFEWRLNYANEWAVTALRTTTVWHRGYEMYSIQRIRNWFKWSEVKWSDWQ